MRITHILAAALLTACAGGPTDEDPTDETPSTSEVVINEFVASNTAGLTDESGAFPDWIELFNAGDADADISGFVLSDDIVDPSAGHTFADDTILEPGGFLVVFCDEDVADGPLHAPFKLSSDGEDIGLFDADLQAIDTLTYEPQTADVSSARSPDGGETWTQDDTPTPGATNG
jgi:hypothetical protein